MIKGWAYADDPFCRSGEGLTRFRGKKNLGRQASFLVLSEPVAGAQDLILPEWLHSGAALATAHGLPAGHLPVTPFIFGCEEETNLKKPAVGFGLHLTLDGYECSYERLTNLDAIYEFLDTCPDMIHMTKIMPPYAFKYHGKVEDDWGLSGFVLIAESHISIHTFPEKGYASVDIFSCKEFDAESASDIIASKFEAKTYERNFMMRGRHFPKDIARSRQIVELERESSKVKEPKL